MTYEEIKTNMETLEKWEFVKFWSSIYYQKDMQTAGAVIKDHPALSKKMVDALKRAFRCRVGDTVVFRKEFVDKDTELVIPEGTVGLFDNIIFTQGEPRNKLYDITVGDKKYRIMKKLSQSEISPVLSSINGNWEAPIHYDNGEPVTKGRMEDEDWYPHYQTLMEMNLTPPGEKAPSIEELMDMFERDHQATFGKAYPDKERLLRWCVFQRERMSHLDSEGGPWA
jgi:hypothetical protein